MMNQFDAFRTSHLIFRKYPETEIYKIIYNEVDRSNGFVSTDEVVKWLNQELVKVCVIDHDNHVLVQNF